MLTSGSRKIFDKRVLNIKKPKYATTTVENLIQE